MDSVIIFNPYNMWDFHLNYEIPIYHNLADRGIRPIYIRCGLDQIECDLHWRAAAGPRPANACTNCKSHTDRSLKAAGIEYESLADHIALEDYEHVKSLLRQSPYEELVDVELMGLRLHDVAMSSVFTHLRINRFNAEDERQLACLREYMIHATGTLLAGAEILKKYRPKAALIFNGRMAATQAFMELCKRHGVRILTHERGITRGGLSLVVNDSCLSMRHLEEISRQHLTHPLKPYQVRLVADWIEHRRIGRNVNWHHFQLDGSAAPQMSSSDGIVHWVLFTSSMDELSNSEEFHSPLGNQYEWIEQTCEAALRLQDKVRLTIRVHPNSSSARSTGVNHEEQSYFQKLKARTSGSQITVIESSAAVDSYLLLDTADLVLCFASTIAIEALLSGKNTYVAAHSPWAYCPGIDSYKSFPDYETFLQDHTVKTSCSLDPEALIQGFRFAYHWLHTYQVTFPFMHQISKSTNKLIVRGKDDFNQGMYPELDRVVDTLIGRRELLDLTLGYFDEACLAAEADAIQTRLKAFPGPLFSVVITNYNYGAYLRNCVESVVAQEQRDCEIIIVDDGSTDDSRDVIAKIIEDHPSAKLIPLFQQNSGQPAIARNNGIKIASGRFIIPLDADDMFANGYLQACRQVIEERPEVNLVTALCVHVYPDRNQLVRYGLFCAGNLALANQIVIASAYSKSLWEKVGGYRENVRGYEDWDMWLNMSLNGAVVAYLESVGLIYNAKDTGLFGNAKTRHDNLYANIIINNRDAFKGNLQAIKWATKYLAEPTKI